MPIIKLSPEDAREAIREWTAAADSLFQQVQQWVAEDRAQDWRISLSLVDITEESLGSYGTQVMEINTHGGRLVLEPVGLQTSKL